MSFTTSETKLLSKAYVLPSLKSEGMVFSLFTTTSLGVPFAKKCGDNILFLTTTETKLLSEAYASPSLKSE
jgi:hypothetical protein